MDLEDIILNEKARHRNTNDVCSHLYVVSKILKLIEVKRRMVMVMAWEQGEMKTSWSNSIKFQLNRIS